MKTIKGRIIRPFLFLLFYSVVVKGQAQTQQLTFSFDSFNISEATSLYSIAGHWSDPVVNGNEALSVTRLTTGIRTPSYSLQIIHRYDSYYKFDNETAHFIYLIENGLALENGRNYTLNIKPDKTSSRGIIFGLNTTHSERFRISGYVSLLKAANLTKGYLNGFALAQAENDYDFSFFSDLVYEEDPLYNRKRESLTGRGFSLDLVADFTFNDRWSINLQLLDVAGELSFDQVAYTRADASSDIKEYDDNGYLLYSPVISGIEGYRDFVYNFKMQTHLSLAYRYRSDSSLLLQHHRVFDFDYQQLILQYQIDRNQLSIILTPELNAAGFDFKHAHFSVGLETDSFDYKKMKYLSLRSQFYWTF